MTNEYKSGLEEQIALDLHKSKVPFYYEPWVLVYYRQVQKGKCLECGSVDVVEAHDYVPDFVSVDGKIVVEAKGKFAPEMRTKMLRVKEAHPNISIRMLFQRNNWVTEKHKSRYTDWCTRNGIPCAVGKFPKEWKTEFKKAKRGVQ